MRLFPPGMWCCAPARARSRWPLRLSRRYAVVFSPAVTHRRPDLYPDPTAFGPNGGKPSDPTPYEYLPFGAGSRRCLGATFAMMELRLVVPLNRPTLPPPAPRWHAGGPDRGGALVPQHAPAGAPGPAHHPPPRRPAARQHPRLAHAPGLRVVPVRGAARRTLHLPWGRRGRWLRQCLLCAMIRVSPARLRGSSPARLFLFDPIAARPLRQP